MIDTQFNRLSQFPLVVNVNSIEMTIPLSALDDDDGNINLGLVGGRIGDVLIADAAPDDSVLSILAEPPEDSAEDLFSVDLEAGELVTFRTVTPQSNSSTTPLNRLDPSLAILDAAGGPLSSDLNSANDGRNAVLSFTAETAGTYYVQVTAEQNAGAYQLLVEREAAPRNGIDGQQIDALARAIATGEQTADLDVDEDGFVTYADLTMMLVHNSSLPGDANFDGRVDAHDLTVWRRHRFQIDPAYSQGDFDANGTSDEADYSIWNANRFTVAAGSNDPHAVRPVRSALSTNSNPSARPSDSVFAQEATESRPARVSEIKRRQQRPESSPTAWESLVDELLERTEWDLG